MNTGELAIKHRACCNVGDRPERILISNIVKSSLPIIDCFVVKLPWNAQCSVGSMRSMCCMYFDDHPEQLLWRPRRRWSLVTLGCTWALQEIRRLMYHEGYPQTKDFVRIDRFLLSSNFFVGKRLSRLYKLCKSIYWFSWRHYGFNNTNSNANDSNTGGESTLEKALDNYNT